MKPINIENWKTEFFLSVLFRVLVGVFLLLPNQLNGKSFYLNRADSIYQLKEHLYHLPPTLWAQNDNIDFFEADFEPLSNYDPIYDAKGYHWLKVELFNEVPNHKDWVFRFSLIPTEIIYFSYPQWGVPKQGKTGFFVPPDERTFKPLLKGNFLRIELPPGKNTTLFFKMKCDRVSMAPEFDIELSSLTHFYDELKSDKQWNGLYVGFILLIFIYNLFLFFLAKDRAYIYYSLYLFWLTIFTVYNTGDLADWLTEILFPQQPQKITYFKLSVYFTIASYLAFLRHFLSLSKVSPKWDRIFIGLSYAALVVLLTDFFILKYFRFNYTIADFATVGFTLLFLTSTVAYLCTLTKSQDNKKYFIIGGFLAMAVGTLFTIYNRFYSVDFSTLPFRIGIVIEVIIFSLGLAYRQREAERQKQETRFELEKNIIFQKQKEKEAAKLEELAEAKNKFYTDIAHEFRTPLTVILGMANQLDKEADNLPISKNEKLQLEEGHHLIRRNGEQLLRQINQLLDLAKLDSGNLTVNLKNGDIVPFLNHLTQSFASVAKAKQITLSFHPDQSELILDFDEDKIRHIINNLLSNALKFTAAQGEIRLEANGISQHEKQWLELTVSDTGMGIKKEDLPHIFDRYFQADQESSGGTGIGLSLVKDLVELLGGKISVTSQTDKGSVFTVRLPIENKTVNTPISTPSPLAKALEKTTAPNGTSPEETSLPTLLIIEDNQDVAVLVERMLKGDYSTLWAENGSVGIDMALEKIPDLILCDVMMPEKNGLEVCETLKTDERTSHIPIVLLTAKTAEADKLAGLKVGADAYLTKPFNQEELFIRLQKLHELRQALQERYSIIFREEGKSPKQLRSVDGIFINKLVKATEKKIDDQTFGVVQLCRIAGMSNTQLNRKLKALIGSTPSRFIRQIRLRKAKELLENPDLNISEIAYQVGFNDPNYFTRLFSEEYGNPPSGTRK